MSEKHIMQAIQVELAKIGVRLFRNNVGFLKDERGQYVHFGLCTGSSDLIGWVPGGRFVAVEVKVPGGRVSVEQYAFIDAVNDAGGIAFIAHSVEEAMKNIRGAM